MNLSVHKKGGRLVDKDTKKILDAAKRQGFIVTTTRRGHRQVWLGDRLVTTFSGTASDWRAMKNALSALRRAGFVWPPRH